MSRVISKSTMYRCLNLLNLPIIAQNFHFTFYKSKHWILFSISCRIVFWQHYLHKEKASLNEMKRRSVIDFSLN